MQNYTSRREILVLLVVGMLVLLTIERAWFEPSMVTRPESTQLAGPSVERQLYRTQVKLLLGASELARQISLKHQEKSQTDSPSASDVDRSISHARDQLLSDDGTVTGEKGRALLRDRIAVAYFLKATPKLNELLEKLLSNSERSASEQSFDQDLTQIVRTGAQITAEQKERLKSQLDILGSAILAGSGDEAEAQLLREKSHSFFIRALVVGGFVVAFLLASLALSLVFLVLMLRGKLSSRFESGGLSPCARLEIFALYLIGMSSAPYLVLWVDSLGLGIPRLALSGGAILLMALIALWPLVAGYSIRALRTSLGLSSSSWGALFRDAALGPIGYIAAWTPLLGLLILYATLVSLAGVDMNRGTHPIVPLLISKKDHQTFLLTVILAVVVAPIVEEIMFRGALYSYLRSRMRPLFALLLTSFLFAVVHPQGPVGIVPLMGIGFVLAVLREWRGSLWASMLAHACFNGGTIALLYVFLL